MHLFRKQESNKLKYQEFGSTLIDWQARDIMSKTIENTHNTIDGYENENSRDSGGDQLGRNCQLCKYMETICDLQSLMMASSQS